MDPVTPTAAPSAPAPSPAPAPSAAPVAAPAPEQSSAPTGGEAGGATQAQDNPGPLMIEAGNFDYDKLSDEDKLRFDNDDFEFIQNTEPAPKSEGGDDDATKDPPQEAPKPTEGESDVLTEAEFAALPPKAQAALRDAQAMIGDEDYKIFKQSKDALDQLLEDPRVQQVIDQRRRGNQFEFNPEAVFDTKSIEAMAKDAGVKLEMIDFSTDPEGSAKILSQVVAKAHQMGLDNGKTVERIQMAQKAEVETRQKKYDDGFGELQKSVQGAKDVPYSDPKSPLFPFFQHLAQGLQTGDFTHKGILGMGIRPMYMAWLESQGKLQELLQKPAANARERFFQDAQKTATHAAVTASQARMGGNPQQNSRHGIDQDKYLTDSTYRQSILDRFEDDDTVMADLQILAAGGRW